MSKRFFLAVLFLLAAALILASCGSFIPKNGEDSVSAQQTQVMETVSAVLTQQAFETLIVQATQQAQVTPLPTTAPTATQVPPTQVEPTQVNTVVVSTATTAPTATKTSIPLPCNSAGFVKDVSIPDNTELAAGAKFTKTWRLVNSGTCTWTTDYDVVFSEGSAMGAPASVALKGSVRPGETVDISVDMVAPSTGGTYKGTWVLRDGSDKLFGLSGGKTGFWVSIKVSAYKSDAVPSAIFPYDFTASICSATWKSNAGLVTLPCPNVSQQEEEWAAVSMNPLLEGKKQEDERTIVMHLDSPNDWMQAFYPAYTIKKGDHFIAFVGCMNSNSACETTFSLDYRIDNGSVTNLGKWNESLDGKYTKIDIDLSQFEGKNLSLILGASNKNSSGGIDLFWLSPSIQNLGS
ncbi:MAG: NBR1-Ig-like domain-containing protein [Bellilinea sp.]